MYVSNILALVEPGKVITTHYMIEGLGLEDSPYENRELNVKLSKLAEQGRLVKVIPTVYLDPADADKADDLRQEFEDEVLSVLRFDALVPITEIEASIWKNDDRLRRGAILSILKKLTAEGKIEIREKKGYIRIPSDSTDDHQDSHCGRYDL